MNTNEVGRRGGLDLVFKRPSAIPKGLWAVSPGLRETNHLGLRPDRFQPQRGCVTFPRMSRNPVGVVGGVARSSQPWTLRRNPCGILLCVSERHERFSPAKRECPASLDAGHSLKNLGLLDDQAPSLRLMIPRLMRAAPNSETVDDASGTLVVVVVGIIGFVGWSAVESSCLTVAVMVAFESLRPKPGGNGF